MCCIAMYLYLCMINNYNNTINYYNMTINNCNSTNLDKLEMQASHLVTFQIVCTTGAKAELSNKDGVEVKIDDSLANNPNNAVMTYKDKWSSKFTWGGDIKNKPVEGDLAVIQKGHY